MWGGVLYRKQSVSSALLSASSTCFSVSFSTCYFDIDFSTCPSTCFDNGIAFGVYSSTCFITYISSGFYSCVSASTDPCVTKNKDLLRMLLQQIEQMMFTMFSNLISIFYGGL